MKRCSKCRRAKSLDEFADKVGKKASWCKLCMRKHMKSHYRKNKPKYLARNKAITEVKMEYIRKLKAVPCTDCKQTYPSYVMEFDHVRGLKVGNVSQLTRAGWKTLLAEITKCEVVCANCHRKRTFCRRGGVVDALVSEASDHAS